MVHAPPPAVSVCGEKVVSAHGSAGEVTCRVDRAPWVGRVAVGADNHALPPPVSRVCVCGVPAHGQLSQPTKGGKIAPFKVSHRPTDYSKLGLGTTAYLLWFT